MDFVLQLHSHMPWVLNHGGWPHGTDWLCEATLGTYLPLIEQQRLLEREGTWAPVTLGVTPILANQLGHPSYPAIFETYVAARLAALAEQKAKFADDGNEGLAYVCGWHHAHLSRLKGVWDDIGGNVPNAFKALADAGRIELTGSAATHGFLPMLGRDESVRLQLQVGMAEHERIFGRRPNGLWLPECAYRPAGWWEPLHHAPHRGYRHGTEVDVLNAGFKFVTLDAPLVTGTRNERPPYRAYRINEEHRPGPIYALARDQRTAAQVWSADGGYPGEGSYLEFHKLHYPGGLKLWRVTGRGVDLGEKHPYWPEVAQGKTHDHARHFATLLGSIAREQHPWGTSLIMAPFDTELFGHWWFEGPEFLSNVYRELKHQPMIRATTASQHIADNPHAPSIPVTPGSWGAHSDWSTWVGPQVAWVWRRLWPLEEQFWRVAGRLIGKWECDAALAQAARTLLLAQSSDWPFIVTMGEARDYGEHRFHSHCSDLEQLLTALEADDFEKANTLAAELKTRDDPFPNVYETLRSVLA
jgi:1,4-alpha-glucan branching enzyme